MATLVVTDDDGVASADTVVVRIEDELPVAVITAPLVGGVVGQSLAFDGRSSSGPAAIVTYAWTFGDGATAAGALVEHAWDSAGTFAVRLTVTDQDGLQANATHSVVIAPPDIAGIWDLVSQDASCANYSIALPDPTLIITQAGADVTAEGGNGRVYLGTLEGGELTLQGNIAINTGSCGTPTVAVLFRSTLDGTSVFSGAASGFIDLAVGCQCSARWDFQATKR